MNITNDYPVTIYRNEKDNKIFYSAGLAKKDNEGKYITGYKDVRFRVGQGVSNKTKIKIKKAWLDFYVKDNKTKDYIFISDFEKVEND